jgi:hypothetical protein
MPAIDSRFELPLPTGSSEAGLLDTSLLDPVLLDIVRTAPLPSLASGPACPELVRWLKRSRRSIHALLPPACIAGLWLLAGDLDASHEISQSDHSPEGSFWHGIMHRREGDFSNAKYWIRRVGRHDALERLAHSDYGDPYRFVDRCEQVTNATTRSLLSLQWLEWQYLFFFCLASKKLNADRL